MPSALERDFYFQTIGHYGLVYFLSRTWPQTWQTYVLKIRKSENVYVYFLVPNIPNIDFIKTIVTGQSSQFPGPLQTCVSPMRDKRSSLFPDGSHQSRKKMNRSLFSVLTLMASLSSRNITLFVPCFVSGVMIQRILLPQVDLDVLIYHRFVLRAHIFVASSINAICPNVLKTKTECHILAKDWKVWLTNINTL